MQDRLPAHLEVSAILRLAESMGGFAMVLVKGERDAGTILIVTLCRDEPSVVYERMPQRDGSRIYLAAKRQDPDKPADFSDYCERRRRQDPDAWLIEVEIADPQRFVAGLNVTR